LAEKFRLMKSTILEKILENPLIIIAALVWAISLYIFSPLAGIVSVVFALSLFGFCKRNWLAANFYHIRGVVVLIGIMLIITLFCQNLVGRYTHPPVDVFTKGKYHVLEHKGYHVKDSLLFTSTRQFENEFNQNLSGDIIIRKNKENFGISCSKVEEPLFIQKNESSSCYKLAGFDNYPTIKNELLIINETDTLLALQISKQEVAIRSPLNRIINKKRFKENYVVNGIVSSFSKQILLGYPMVDIVLKTPESDINSDFLSGCYLIRSEISLSKNVTIPDAELKFFPGRSLLMLDNLSIICDGKDVSSLIHNPKIKENDFVIGNNCNLFWGLGRNKSEHFKLKVADDNYFDLLYTMPKRFELKDEIGQHKQFILSNYKDIGKQDINSGFLLGSIDCSDSEFHINASLNYEILNDHNNNVPLKWWVSDNHNRTRIDPETGEEFLLSGIGNQNTQDNGFFWIMNLSNRRAENFLGSALIQFIVFIIFVLFAIRFFLIHLYFKRKDYLTYSPERNLLDFILFNILIVFITIRFVLLWRISTFPPLDGISSGEWSQYTDITRNVKLTCVFIAMYYLALVISDIWYFIKMTPGKTIKKSPIRITPPQKDLFVWLVIIIVGVGIVLFAFMVPDGLFKRIGTILAPLLYYFLSIFWVNNIYNGRQFQFKKSILFLNKNRDWKIKSVWLINFPVIVFTLIALSKDFGYLLIFAITISIHLIFTNWLLGKDWNSSYDNNIIKRILYLPFFRRLISKHEVNRITTIISWGTITLLYIAILIGGFEFVKSPLVSDYLKDHESRIFYRIHILDKSADDLIESTNYEKNNIQYLLWAAHNQAFIDEYYNKSQNLNEYFHLKEHFKTGVPYFVQTTDIAPIRFLLAEHRGGALFIISFLLVLIMVAIVFIDIYSVSDSVNRGMFSMILLLIITVFIIWLTVTNRFIFIGQDFPFLSPTSLLSVLLPLFLFALLLILPKRELYNEDGINNGIVSVRAQSLIVTIVFILGAIMLYYSLSKPKLETQGRPGIFNLNKTVGLLTNEIKILDNDFSRFQEENLSLTQSSFGTQIVDKYLECYDTVGISSFTRNAIEEFKLQQNKKDVDNLIYLKRRNDLWHLAVSGSFYAFTMPSAKENRWRGNILATGSDNIVLESTDGRIFWSNDKSVLNCENDDHAKMIRKKIEVKYFKKPVVEEPVVTVVEKYIEDVPLQVSVTSNPKSTELASTSVKGFKLAFGDTLFIREKSGKIVEKLVLALHKPYLARALEINNKPAYFYPLEHRFMWPYNAVNLISAGRSTIEDKGNDFKTTFDNWLTKEIYDIIEDFNQRDKIWQKNEREISDFYRLPFEEKCKLNNGTPFFIEDGKVCCIDKKLNSICNTVNRRLRFEPGSLSDKINASIRSNMARMNFSVVVADGNGAVRSMVQNIKSEALNPNSVSSIRTINRALASESTVTMENEVYGNSCLLNYKRGPGSAIKPIFYSTVTSQKRLPWEKINIVYSYNNWTSTAQQLFYKSPKANKNAINNYFAGRLLDDGNTEFTPVYDYTIYQHANLGNKPSGSLTVSDNIYQTLVTFLGSYSDQQLDNLFNKESGILIRTKSKNPTENTFPILNIQGKNYFFNSDFWPNTPGSNSYFGNPGSLLGEGLKVNFGILTKKLEDSGVPYINDLTDNTDIDAMGQMLLGLEEFAGLSSTYPWCFPDKSTFYQELRTETPNFISGIRNPSLGSYPLRTTPVAMTMYYGRLFSMDNTYRLTVNDDKKYKRLNTWDFDEEGWGNKDDLFNFYRDYIYKPMAKVINTDISAVGTLEKDFWDNLNDEERGIRKSTTEKKYGQNPAVKVNGQTYYLYAKTGTMSNKIESDNFEHHRDKMLALIITNKDLSRLNHVNELANIKSYIIFFSFVDMLKETTSERIKPMADITKSVLSSSAFNLYMNGDKDVRYEIH